MKPADDLGALLVAFVNRVSHPRGRAVTFLAKAGITVGQAILLNLAAANPDSTPSSLAAAMRLSLPSASQMLDRLVKLGYLRRREDAADRRRKTISVTRKTHTFLARFRAVRSAEFVAGTAGLTPATRKALIDVLTLALGELGAGL